MNDAGVKIAPGNATPPPPPLKAQNRHNAGTYFRVIN
jgi:hypothetical protein